MFAVVGCSDCDALWIVEGRPETTACRRCGSRHRFERLRALATADDEESARAARTRLLAARGDEDLPEAALATDADVEQPVVGDAAYLEAFGVDADAADEAGERAERGAGSVASGSRADDVLAAIDALADPTARAIVEHAGERGRDPEAVRETLEKLERGGEILETDGSYRRL